MSEQTGPDADTDTAPDSPGVREPDPATAGPGPDDRREDPPLPASAWIAEHSEPTSEAERETAKTIRSISRLEESN